MSVLQPLAESRVDFSDPTLLRALGAMGASNKCSYLLALAAWQRGLTVEFFGNQADARVNLAHMPGSHAQPSLFLISDGRRRHFFNRSMGDATSRRASELATDKALSKQRFLQAGVKTPDYVLWQGDNAAEVRDFLARHPNRSFVLKPLIGSVRSGVQTDVPAAHVILRLSRIGAVATLVEEQIKGLEHRVYVVGDRAVAALLKPGVSVIGTGRDSVAQLIARKNAPRAANPAMATCLIDPAAAVRYLAEFGQDLTRVPVFGERVVLSTSNNLADGADVYSVKGGLNATIASKAVAAAQSLDVPNGALDIIFDGQDPYVLEVNVRAQIVGHSVPTVGVGSGNVVAESIVDWYFPTPDGSAPQRHTAILDIAPVLDTFARLGTKAYYKITPRPDEHQPQG